MTNSAISSVHVVISDRGWILERLAEELKRRLPYVSYDTTANPDAVIQYYMTYGTYKGRVSPHEIGLFTHLEQHEAVAKKFFDVASRVDLCVAMSRATEALLVGRASRTTVISPGVDLERFSPKLRIGVIGRTYHTGRKGEDLVAAVQDVPGIEWVFTGEGWPGPSQFVSEEDLPNFYRSLDYVLVPARIEGGPMCVLEALASGVEVIAPPVGWVPEFPHIEFRTGDAEDLRRVLLALLDKRAKLRQSVEAYTWNNWANQHHELFISMAGEKQILQERSAVTPVDMRAVVAVHGVEMTESAGGPSIRAPMTATALKRAGVDATFEHTSSFDPECADIVHIMNVWEPEACELLVQKAKKVGKPVVLSSIYLDLTEHDIYSQGVPGIFAHGADDRLVLPGYEALRARLAARRAEGTPSYEILPNYYGRIRKLLAQVDHVILLSQDELAKLRRIGAEPAEGSYSIVHNPVVATNFTEASPEVFEKAYGIRNYVLVVGRIESRKNQLTLAYALRDLPYPVVFIGHNNDGSYLNLVKSVSGPNVHFIGRLEPNSEILASAFAGAKVFCMPSWSEGAPLAALEAGATGARMILSDRSSEREYFGSHAWYCDPADPVSMRELVVRAYEEEYSDDDREKLKQHVRTRFNWDIYVRGTRQAYESAIKHHSAANSTTVPAPTSGRILFDLTTLAHRNGPPSGIARVEDRLAVELVNLYPDRVSFFLWNSHFKCFLPVPQEILHDGAVNLLRGAEAYSSLRNSDSRVPYDQMEFKPGDTVVVFGGAWIRNVEYLNDLQHIRKACGVKLVTTIYDVIQWKFMNWFPSGVGGEFATNCKRLISFSDRILTCSQKSKDDILQFAATEKVAPPAIDVFRLGDDAESIDPNASIQLDHVAPIIGRKPFVLYVSSIDVRKNHKLLLDVWERLAEKHAGQFPKLILVGSRGWGGDSIIERLDASPILKNIVHILHGINDVTLQWLYRNCMFTIYPSLYEGWGLPVAESLSLGKFCIVSDAGSLPEIAPGLVDMIDPRDFVSWVASIERYALQPHLLKAKQDTARSYRRQSWGDTAQTIGARLDGIKANVELAELPIGSQTFLGAPKGTSESDQATSGILVGGWGAPEPQGRWTIGSAAAFCFQVTEKKPVALSIFAFAYEGGDVGPQIVDVVLNGTVIAVWKVDKTERWLSAPLDHGLLVDGTKAVVRLNIRAPRVPRFHNVDSLDSRPLGLFVKSVAIEPILELRSGELVETGPISTDKLVLSLAGQEIQENKYLLLGIEATATGVLEVVADGQKFTKLQVPLGQKNLVLRLTDLGVDFGRPTILGIHSDRVDELRILEAGVFSRVPAEKLHGSTREQDWTADELKHVSWLGHPPKVGLNNDILLVQGNNVTLGMAGGWFTPEQNGTWSSGSRSSLHLALPKVSAKNLQVELTLDPFEWIFAFDHRAEFEILVGTAGVKKVWRTCSGVWTTSIPVATDEAVDDNGILRITLRGPVGIVAPNADPDNRPLSFKLISLNIRSAREIDLQPNATMLIGDDVRELLLDNWHRPEPNLVWSPGGDATKLRLPQLLDSSEVVSVALYIEVYAGLLARGPCSIRFLVGDTEVGSEVRSDPGSRPVVLRLPKSLIDPDLGTFVLSICTPDGISPFDHDGSLDGRPLAFNVQAVHYLA